MPDFSPSFMKSKGQPILYKGKQLLMGDFIPFEDRDSFLITFEKTNSEWKQGIGLDVNGDFEINKIKYGCKIVLWEDNYPQGVIITICKEKTDKRSLKRQKLTNAFYIKNIWDMGEGRTSFWINGAAMISEEIPNGRRYYCNDGHPDENFEDIIFTIQKIPAQQ